MPQRLHVTCTFKDCQRPHKAAGYCQTHYMQLKRNSPLTEIKPRDRTPHEYCSEDGCVEPVKAKGLCMMHYARYLRHGHTKYRDRKKPPRYCSMPSCEDILYSKGLCHKHYIKRRDLKERYGMDTSAYMAMLEKHRFVCAICEKPETNINGPSRKVKSLSIDHCHTTGKVRGMLCGNCNRGLGFFGDDPAVLKRAIAYLKKG